MEILPPVGIGERNRSIPGCRPKRVVGRQKLTVLRSVFQILFAAPAANLPNLAVALVVTHEERENQCKVNEVRMWWDLDQNDETGNNLRRIGGMY